MDSARARSFGAAAADYARGRPGYPPAAVRSVLPPDARDVLDLGAGTGKLTSVLLDLDLGLSVTAVEPDDAMRLLIDPRASVLVGTAEAVPLPDGSVDAVLVGQAWHWFDPVAAVAEVRRVLRPGGTLGLLWNLLDDGAPWCAEVASLVGMEDRLSAMDGHAEASQPAPGFGWTRHVEAFGQPADIELLLDNLRSRSVVILRTPDERRVLLDRVRAVVPSGSFVVPWVCEAWRGEPVA